MVVNTNIAVDDKTERNPKAHAGEIDGVGIVNGHIRSANHGFPVKTMITPSYHVWQINEERDGPYR